MKRIKQKLMERGYNEKQAIVTAKELLTIDEMLKGAISLWMDKDKETDFTIEGVCLSNLKAKFKMTYPAALLTMDWVIKEPEKAKNALIKGIR